MKRKIIISVICCTLLLMITTGCESSNNIENNNLSENQEEKSLIIPDVSNVIIEDNNYVTIKIESFRKYGNGVAVRFNIENKTDKKLYFEFIEYKFNDMKIEYAEYSSGINAGQTYKDTLNFDKKDFFTNIEKIEKFSINYFLKDDSSNTVLVSGKNISYNK